MSRVVLMVRVIWVFSVLGVSKQNPCYQYTLSCPPLRKDRSCYLRCSSFWSLFVISQLINYYRFVIFYSVFRLFGWYTYLIWFTFLIINLYKIKYSSIVILIIIFIRTINFLLNTPFANLFPYYIIFSLSILFASPVIYTILSCISIPLVYINPITLSCCLCLFD